MSVPAQRRATYEDLLQVPEHLVAEIINGVLHTSPRPAPLHANASSLLGSDLVGPYHRGRGGPGGWWILDEPELHLGPEVLVPDLAGWRRERMPRLPQAAFFDLAPDWVCEVLSTSTALRDRTEKLPLYAQYEVRHLWFVDPRIRTLEVLRLEEGRWVIVSTHGADDLVRAEPFGEVEIELRALWDDGGG